MLLEVKKGHFGWNGNNPDYNFVEFMESSDLKSSRMF